MSRNFSSLFGNEKTVSRLVGAINNSTLPHAFLVVGKDGSGKKTLARELAMAINCEREGEFIPCHRCNTCRRIKDGNFTDIYTLKRDSQKASLGVVEVRDFKASAMLSPVESDYKFYVIEDAETLTVQAQNALLTFLEEPPKNTYIMLLARSADTILTTVKSRTQAINMSKFEREELSEFVTRLSERARNVKRLNQDAFDSIIMNSDGLIGRALSIIDEGRDGEILKSAQITEEICECICKNSSYSDLYLAVSKLPTDRKKFVPALEGLILAIRDIILCRFDEKCVPVFYSSREKAISLSKKTSSKKLLKVYDILTLALQDAKSNVGISALITGIATKIKLL